MFMLESVLSGLTPATILEICSRFVHTFHFFLNESLQKAQKSYFLLAVSDSSREVRLLLFVFRLILTVSYSAFQQAVVRNVNDKNGQLQKQLDNVIREGELNDIFRHVIYH